MPALITGQNRNNLLTTDKQMIVLKGLLCALKSYILKKYAGNM